MDHNRRLVDWEDTYVSTGQLPPSQQVSQYVAEAHAMFANDTEGQVSQVYPALAQMPALLRRQHGRHHRQLL
ncbi:MAG: hypothetical protein WDA15_03845 [Trueperaceae bacterium]